MAKRMNYFIEGLQGAGKSTLVQALSENINGSQVFREGDYSPVELAWCAYVTEQQYQSVLESYPNLKDEIMKKTVAEKDHKIICYTQILTDVPGFHKNLEQYEIYNGNLDRAAFERVILDRYEQWTGEGQIFECSIFQNIIENQLLYFMMTEKEILSFYRKVKQVLGDKAYRILYLDVEDIRGGIEIIRKERSDDEGNELWFPLMIRYLEESPYGRKYNLKGMEGLITHLERRKAVEHLIMDEIFAENAIVLKAKNYDMDELLRYVQAC